MNDDDRENLVNNDEGLYDMWKRSGLSMRKFVRKHRRTIDEVAGNVKSGKKPQHYLKYEQLPDWILRKKN